MSLQTFAAGCGSMEGRVSPVTAKFERRTMSASRVEPWISDLFIPDRAFGRGFLIALSPARFPVEQNHPVKSIRVNHRTVLIDFMSVSGRYGSFTVYLNQRFVGVVRASVYRTTTARGYRLRNLYPRALLQSNWIRRTFIVMIGAKRQTAPQSICAVAQMQR